MAGTTTFTVALAVQGLKEAVDEADEAKAAYHAKIAARDALIRAAAADLTYSRLMALTGLSREALSRIVNRRDPADRA